jgi:hypothetical protein
VALTTAGVLVVAVHLGIGGAALAASAWTGWAANAVVAIVLLKLAFMGGHVVLGRLVLRRGRAATPRWIRHGQAPKEPAD